MTTSPPFVHAWIALGGNLGEVLTSFHDARQTLHQHPQCAVLQSSKVYRTPPIGPQNQPDYLNAVIQIQTQLSPLELLTHLQHIEQCHGRVRTLHWGARTLDLDIIAYGEQTLNSERLTLPHAYMHVRQFVLRPMCDISSNWRHPILHQTAQQLLSNCLSAGEPPLPEGKNWP